MDVFKLIAKVMPSDRSFALFLLLLVQLLSIFVSMSLGSNDNGYRVQRYNPNNDQTRPIPLRNHNDNNNINNEPEPVPISNLSCYKCLTIEDMRCRYLNETIGARINNNNNNNNIYNNRHNILSSNEASEFDQYNEYDQFDPYNPPGEHNDSVHQHGGYNLADTFKAQCEPNEHYCVVLRFGVSSKTVEDQYNFFALKRGCASECTEGCFIIGKGERTKLSFCSTCCKDNFCNVGNWARARWSSEAVLPTWAFTFVVPFLWSIVS